MEQVTGDEKDSVTNIVVKIAAFENKLTTPNQIQPSSYDLPTEEVIQKIADEIDHPADENASEQEQQFSQDIKALNATTQSLDKALQDPKQQEILQRISKHLKLELGKTANRNFQP